jgi:hypothetical protein
MDNSRLAQLRIRCKENCGTEDPLERSNQPSIFFTAFVHSERLEHFGATFEPNHLTLLSNSESRQENRDYAVLTERKTVIRMSGHLQNKVTVAPLEEDLPRWRPANRQTAENEWTRTESQVLLSQIAFQMDQLDTIQLAPDLLRNLELRVVGLIES